MKRYKWDYEWRECLTCERIWEFAPPLFCIHCGTATTLAAMPVLPIDSSLHGTERGYKIYGCKCEPCTVAHRYQNREYYRKHFGDKEYNV